MNAILDFGIKGFHYRAVLRDAAEPIKMGSRDYDTKMGFTAFAPAGVTMMEHRFFDHIEESGANLLESLAAMVSLTDIGLALSE